MAIAGHMLTDQSPACPAVSPRVHRPEPGVQLLAVIQQALLEFDGDDRGLAVEFDLEPVNGDARRGRPEAGAARRATRPCRARRRSHQRVRCDRRAAAPRLRCGRERRHRRAPGVSRRSSVSASAVVEASSAGDGTAPRCSRSSSQIPCARSGVRKMLAPSSVDTGAGTSSPASFRASHAALRLFVRRVAPTMRRPGTNCCEPGRRSTSPSSSRATVASTTSGTRTSSSAKVTPTSASSSRSAERSSPQPHGDQRVGAVGVLEVLGQVGGRGVARAKKK